MISQFRPVSAYLVKPSLTPRRQPSWNGLTLAYKQIRRENPGILRKSAVVLAVWCCAVAGLQSAPQLTGSATASHTATSQPQLASTTNRTGQVKPAAVTVAIHAPVLPSGPSGQLLPPGTMAPDGTYANSYARGQCTWYVAGRRQIPSNWGNARSWYYNATAKGWSVGTVPAVAAIAWTPAGYYGHVALVEEVSADGKQVHVSEMNYLGVGIKSFRWAPAGDFKYIY